jgi:hypothetical protein
MFLDAPEQQNKIKIILFLIMLQIISYQQVRDNNTGCNADTEDMSEHVFCKALQPVVY